MQAKLGTDTMVACPRRLSSPENSVRLINGGFFDEAAIEIHAYLHIPYIFQVNTPFGRMPHTGHVQYMPSKLHILLVALNILSFSGI